MDLTDEESDHEEKHITLDNKGEVEKYTMCKSLDIWPAFSPACRNKWKDIIETVAIWKQFNSGNGPSTYEEFDRYQSSIRHYTQRLSLNMEDEAEYVQMYSNPFQFMASRNKRFVFELNVSDKRYFMDFLLPQCYENNQIDTSIFDTTIIGQENWDLSCVAIIEKIMDHYSSSGLANRDTNLSQANSAKWDEYFFHIARNICDIPVKVMRESANSVKVYNKYYNRGNVAKLCAGLFNWSPHFEIMWMTELLDSKSFLMYHHYSCYDALPINLQIWFYSDFMTIKRVHKDQPEINKYINCTKAVCSKSASIADQLQFEFWKWFQQYRKYIALYSPQEQGQGLDMESFLQLYCKLLDLPQHDYRTTFHLKWHTRRIANDNISLLWSWTCRELQSRCGDNIKNTLEVPTPPLRKHRKCQPPKDSVEILQTAESEDLIL